MEGDQQCNGVGILDLALADSSSEQQRVNPSIEEPFGVVIPGTNEVHKESGCKHGTKAPTAIMGFCEPDFGVVAADSTIIGICPYVIMAGLDDDMFFGLVQSSVPAEIARQPIPEAMGDLVEIVVRKMNDLILQGNLDALKARDFDASYILLGRLNNNKYSMYSITLSSDQSSFVATKEICRIINYGSESGALGLMDYQTQHPLDDWMGEFEGVSYCFKCMVNAVKAGYDGTCPKDIEVGLIDKEGCRKYEFTTTAQGEYVVEPRIVDFPF